METKKSPGLLAKIRRKGWTKDDTELTFGNVKFFV